MLLLNFELFSLVERLVQICERQASDLLNLKNCGEVLQIANDYSAKQLVRSASQFICQNLAALLESKSLDILSDECVDKLTRYYFDSFPSLYHRRITPYNNSPSNEEIEKAQLTIDEIFDTEEALLLVKQQTSNSTIEDIGKKSKHPFNKGRPRNSSGDCNSSGEDGYFTVSKSRRRRHRKSSCGSISSFGSSDSEEDNISVRKSKETEVIETDFGLIEREQDPPFIKVKDKKEHQRKSTEFVSSLLRLPYNLEKQENILTTPPILKAPPTSSDINKNELEVKSASSTKMAKFTKKSQKERKRLNSQSLSGQIDVEQSPEFDKPKWTGWSNGQTPCDEPQLCLSDSNKQEKKDSSLVSIMKSQKSNLLPEEMGAKSIEASKAKQCVKKPKSWRALDLNETSPASKPAPTPSVNPWSTKHSIKSNEINTTKCSFSNDIADENSVPTFQDIMHQETLQKESIYRAQSKSLTITQLEEQAIEELEQFYNIDNVFDELIIVQRANASELATPVWNPKRNVL